MSERDDTLHSFKQPTAEKDYFVEADGMRFAGRHLLLELWEASRLDDLAHVEAALREATEASGATLLEIKLHHFEGGGVSGVAILAESHISIHTWPERRYAAIDIFMCGCADPYLAVPVLREAFAVERLQVSEHRRGVLPS
jgi:S-adenosylmethionine decarboxylase